MASEERANANAEMDPAQQHQSLIDAFPDTSLRHVFLAAGCWGITERGGTAPSEFYSGQCSILQVVRELGLMLLYSLLHSLVQAKGPRGDISVQDVNDARNALCMKGDDTIDNDTMLLSCPSSYELVRRAKQPASPDEDEREDQILIDANRARELMQKRLMRRTADLLRDIHISQGGSGERGDDVQKRLAALYQSPAWRDLDTCLFLPHTKFEILILAVLQSFDRHSNRLSVGAKSLIQLTCEEELIFVIKSAWTALRHYGTRKSVACEDIIVMVHIMKPVMKSLHVRLPGELKNALDEADKRPSRRQNPEPARGRGAGKARERRRSRSRNPG